jgi:hypothetical protein
MPTIEQLLKLLEKRLDDETGADSQKNWQAWEKVRYLSEGQDETNKELLILKEDQDFTEVVASGSLTFTAGTTGQITSVSVNGVVITSAPVPFDISIAQTLIDLANNINAFSASGLNVIQPLSTYLEKTTIALPYIASANGSVLTITAPSGTGFSPNGYVISAIVTGDFAFTSIPMSGGSCMCKIFIIPGQRRYQIHQKSYLITRNHPEHLEQPIEPVTKGQMDNMYPGWQRMRPGIPIRYIPDYQNKNIIIVPEPRIYSTAFLDVVRFPYSPFDLSNLKATPEIAEEYTACIIPWAMRQAFLKNDRETLSTLRSERWEKEFYRLIDQSRIIHKIRRNPQASATNHIPAGLL